jgi:hypothetical protein
MHTGKKHDSLGVDLDFNNDGTLDVHMIAYLMTGIAEFPELMNSRAATPAIDHLFTVQDEKEATRGGESIGISPHGSTVLFITTRVRCDLQRAVAFLTTRVKSPDEDNWGKLKLVLKYLNGNKHLKLKLSVEDWGLLKWYVDRSYNTHWDCR